MRDEASRPAEVGLRGGLRDAAVAFVVARVALFAISVMAVGSLPLPLGQPTTDSGFPAPALGPGWHALFTGTQRQDALWMLRLATHGYAPGDGSAAFFPLYPMVVRAVAWLPGVGPLGAALLVSNAAFFAALLFLHALTRFELGSGAAAQRTVFFAAVFPTAFFFLAPYTESLFLLLSIATFWFARRDRWLWAAIAGALAAATRSVGLLLIIGLAYEAFHQRHRLGRAIAPRLAATAGVAAGPLAFFAYWQLRFHDLLAPLDAQRNWQRQTAFPLTTLWQAIVRAWQLQGYWLIDVVVVGLAIGGVAYATWRRIPGAYVAYAIASLALPLMFPFPDRPLLSMPRFVAVVFPATWGFALAVERGIPESAVTAAFAIGYGGLAWLFVTWWPVF